MGNLSYIFSNHYFRFVVVGLMNTSFSFFIYSTFLFFGFTFQIANLIALILGVIFSFKAQGYFVFFNKNNWLIYRFAASWAVIYFFTITIIGWIVSFGFNAYVAGALSLPFSVILSYLAQRFFVFRHSNMDKIVKTDVRKIF